MNDGLDNHCPGDAGFGLVDELTGAAGFFNVNDPDEFFWEAQAGAILYDVLRSNSPDFADNCTLSTIAGTSMSSPMSPTAGQIEFWMARPLTPSQGDWGYEYRRNAFPELEARDPFCF